MIDPMSAPFRGPGDYWQFALEHRAVILGLAPPEHRPPLEEALDIRDVGFLCSALAALHEAAPPGAERLPGFEEAMLLLSEAHVCRPDVVLDDDTGEETPLPIPGSRWRHWKHGHVYQIKELTRCSETQEERVTYVRIEPPHRGLPWSRPLAMWYERVQTGQGMVPRFESV
jgi:hypothetical protein